MATSFVLTKKKKRKIWQNQIVNGLSGCESEGKRINSRSYFGFTCRSIISCSDLNSTISPFFLCFFFFFLPWLLHWHPMWKRQRCRRFPPHSQSCWRSPCSRLHTKKRAEKTASVGVRRGRLVSALIWTFQDTFKIAARAKQYNHVKILHYK